MSQMVCPRCGNQGTDVVSTRVRRIGLQRTEICKDKECRLRFNSLELPVDVVKRLTPMADQFETALEEAWQWVKETFEGGKKSG